MVELNENMAGNDAVVSCNQPGVRKIDEVVDLFVALAYDALAQLILLIDVLEKGVLLEARSPVRDSCSVD